MGKRMMRRSLVISLLIALPVLAFASGPQSSSDKATGGDFSLLDHNGKTFRLSDQRGKVILLFFGYTSCTEACPIILGRINSVFKQLGSDQEKALAVFVSVYPQRDPT